MKNAQDPAGFPEHNEHLVQHAEKEGLRDSMPANQLLLDSLMEAGFAWEEAVKLLQMREDLYDNVEMRQRMADDNRMQFARWLYERGDLSEA